MKTTGEWFGLPAKNGTYGLYLPKTLEQCAPCVLIAGPDHKTAKAFAKSPIGKKWKKVAEKNGVALCYAEPENGGEWHWNGGGRDEEAFLSSVSQKLHSKSAALTCAFNLNERAFYVVGYDCGSYAAEQFVSAWPALVAGAMYVRGAVVADAKRDALKNRSSFPFAEAENLEGVEENRLLNRDVPVPTASVVPVKGLDAPEKLYRHLEKYQRFAGEPGGRLSRKLDFANDGRCGFFYSEDKIDGLLRRWWTYIPSSYKPGCEVPLVLAIHGYCCTMSAYAAESRWHDVAEENGFIVVFPQAYVNRGIGGNIPLPVWNTYTFSLGKTESDDISFLRHVIALTKDRYSIDNSRVYVSGHSNGSSMTWALGLDAAELFAAIAPVGLSSGAYRACPLWDEETMVKEELLSMESSDHHFTHKMPVWMFKGEYDIEDGAALKEDTANLRAMRYWTSHNCVGRAASVDDGSEDAVRNFEASQLVEDDSFITRSFCTQKENIPLFRYSEVRNSPHAYLPEEARRIWTEFFTDFSKTKDGDVCYRGLVIK